MSTVSRIEWTDTTWNPVVGCAKVSEGCRNCYAMKEAHRMAGNPNAKVAAAYEGLTRNVPGKGPQWTGRVRCLPERLGQPLHWRKPRRVFVNSMSDLFHPNVPDEFVMAVFGVMAACPQHQFQILTKRPERMADLLGQLTELVPGRRTRLAEIEGAVGVWPPNECMAWAEVTGGIDLPEEPAPEWPLPNVWLGTSVENQAAADERIPHLLRTPAAVRWLSCEPLLGPVKILGHLMQGPNPGRCLNCGKSHAFARCPNYGGIVKMDYEWRCTEFRRAQFAIGWVVAGGESGPAARPCDAAFLRSLRDQCTAAAVPFFLKQFGRHWYEGLALVEGRDRKGGDPSEWPEDLRVREWPR